MKTGDVVYFSKTEEFWDKPFPMKSHHVYDTRSVVLQGEVLAIEGDEFKAKLFGNNGFEKDGEVFVFHKLDLLLDQNFQRKDILGMWKTNQVA